MHPQPIVLIDSTDDYGASLKLDYQGSEFGSGVKALVIMLYRDAGMTARSIESQL